MGGPDDGNVGGTCFEYAKSHLDAEIMVVVVVVVVVGISVDIDVAFVVVVVVVMSQYVVDVVVHIRSILMILIRICI